MPRKPNFDFERRQRELARAQKKADRERAKQAKSDQRKAVPDDGGGEIAGDITGPADAGR